jgi:hypothetical protein
VKRWVFENSCFTVFLGSEVGCSWLIPVVVLRGEFERWLIEFVGGGTRVGFDRDAGNSQSVIAVDAIVTLVFDAEIEAVVVAEVLVPEHWLSFM